MPRPSNQCWLLGHGVDAVEVDAQRAPDIAQRRARPVADDDAGQRGAVAAVLAVDVLDDLLAALVLEVDVDVGRLVALGADEVTDTCLLSKWCLVFDRSS
jgi:hypothetical protein